MLVSIVLLGCLFIIIVVSVIGLSFWLVMVFWISNDLRFVFSVLLSVVGDSVMVFAVVFPVLGEL